MKLKCVCAKKKVIPSGTYVLFGAAKYLVKKLIEACGTFDI